MHRKHLNGKMTCISGCSIPAGVTSIADDAFQFSPGLVDFHAEQALTLRVEKGSYAEQYAKEKGIPYEHIEE